MGMSHLRRWYLLLLPVLLFSAYLVAVAGSAAYRLELTMLTDRDDEFVFIVELDDRQFSRLKNNPSEEMQPFLVAAKREYAQKAGFRREMYGDENYKMVTIQRYSYVVKESFSGRVVLRKE